MIRKLISIFTSSSQKFEGEQAGEKTLMIIRAHTFLVWSRLSVLLLITLLPFLFGTLVPQEYQELFWLGVSILYLILWIIAFHILTMHALNTVIITDHRVIENEQRGFFERKVSELNLHNIQDVTAQMKGVVPTVLHFGQILIHTAAEEDMFIFENVPYPERVKDAIMKVIHLNSIGSRT